MARKFSFITLGMILEEIKREGQAKGKDWSVKRLFIIRNEDTPENREKFPKKERFIFPIFERKSGTWRVYTEDQAKIMKDLIKKARGYA